MQGSVQHTKRTYTLTYTRTRGAMNGHNVNNKTDNVSCRGCDKMTKTAITTIITMLIM